MTEQMTFVPVETQKVWEFRVYGEPMQYLVPQTQVVTYKVGDLLCVRVNPKTRHAVIHSHLDDRVTAWENKIRKQIRFDLRTEFDPILAGGPIRMELWIFLTRPKSVMSMFPDKAPDRDNFEKAVLDGVEAGLRHDVACDAKGKITKTEGFNDGQIVSGPTELRWAYMNYPDCGRHRPGLIVKLQRMDTSREKELNLDYRAYLKQQGLEYVTEVYGSKNDKKRTVLRKVE